MISMELARVIYFCIVAEFLVVCLDDTWKVRRK